MWGVDLEAISVPRYHRGRVSLESEPPVYNVKQELSENDIVCQRQPNSNSNCQLVCVKIKVKVFVYGDDNAAAAADKSSQNIYIQVNLKPAFIIQQQVN